MIHKIDHRNRFAAKEIQRIQQPAYKVEAELMNFSGIPQLNESVPEIQASDETFLGFMEEGQLVGFIAYKVANGKIDIHRLVVEPAHFRKGIGRRLLAFLMNEFEGMEFVVSTGKANRPAKNLYAGLGFIESADFEVAPGVYCTELKKVPIDIRLEE